MKVRFKMSFRDRLNEQVTYIARDKPKAARVFKNEIILRIKEIPKQPYSYRKSIFFNRNDIRDLVFKGYLVVFKINEKNEAIEVFGFTKWEENPFGNSEK